MLNYGLALACLVSLVSADPFWVVRHGTLVQSRLDPIIAPGVVSGHTHAIIGTSSFNPTYTYNNSESGTCVTANVNVDKSSYWVPQLYSQWPNGTFTLQTFRGANTYYQVRRQKNEPMVEFPPGFRMMAGNPYRTTYDDSDPAQKAVRYACLGISGPETNKFPDQYCPGGLRAEVYFPHCWDGKNNWLENSAHVAYGIEGQFDGGGQCPDTHPKRIMGLFFEFYFDDVDPSKGGGKRVWAMGDDLGYGMHGDFTNGWPEGFFSKIFAEGETCDVGFSLENCPPLKEVMTDTSNCEYSGLIVDEEIGHKPITKLLGNNPVFGLNGARQADPKYVETADFVQAVDGMPGGGQEIPPPPMVSPTQINAGNQHIASVKGDTPYTGPTFIAGDGATGGAGGGSVPTTTGSGMPTSTTMASSTLMSSATMSQSSHTFPTGAVGVGGVLLGQGASSAAEPSASASSGDDQSSCKAKKRSRRRLPKV